MKLIADAAAFWPECTGICDIYSKRQARQQLDEDATTTTLMVDAIASAKQEDGTYDGDKLKTASYCLQKLKGTLVADETSIIVDGFVNDYAVAVVGNHKQNATGAGVLEELLDAASVLGSRFIGYHSRCRLSFDQARQSHGRLHGQKNSNGILLIPYRMKRIQWHVVNFCRTCF